MLLLIKSALTILLFYQSVVSEKIPHEKTGTMTLQMVRQKAPMENLINYAHHFKGHWNDVYKSKDPRNNDSIALYRFLNDEFYGTVNIGKPSQIFNVAFDTTWQYTWVTSSRCSSIKTFGCYFHNKYDHSRSTSYKEDGRPFFENLGSYNLTGIYSYDNITIGHTNNTRQSFIEMNYLPYTFIYNKIDGVIGLGLKTDDYDPFFYTLLKEKKIANPIYSIYLNRDPQSNVGGNIMLGFINEKHIHHTDQVPDNFTYLSVDKSPYWQFQMDRIIIDVIKPQTQEYVIVCDKGCKAIVDTASNSIYGPKLDVDKIHDTIGANEFLLNRYTVDCDTVNKLPLMEFVLNGKNFTLKGEDYTVKMSWHSITICLSAFQPAEVEQESNRWILGGAFLASYYTVYNVQEQTIGFVKAN